jgi:hypothetical protein
MLMGYAELIAQKLGTLPPEKLAEVYDFVEFIAARVSPGWTDAHFQSMSLAQAMRDAEDDPVAYAQSDCRETWS